MPVAYSSPRMETHCCFKASLVPERKFKASGSYSIYVYVYMYPLSLPLRNLFLLWSLFVFSLGLYLSIHCKNRGYKKSSFCNRDYFSNLFDFIWRFLNSFWSHLIVIEFFFGGGRGLMRKIYVKKIFSHQQQLLKFWLIFRPWPMKCKNIAKK